MSASILLRAVGLNTQPNQLDQNSVPPGSLTTASNVIIRRDNVIEPRRGYRLYGSPVGSTSDVAKQLTVYKNRIIRHFNSTLEFDTMTSNQLGQSIFTAFAGSYTEPLAGRRMRFIEANSNLYFTTSDGVKKISAASAADFTSASGFITQAGGIKAVDLTTRLNVTLGDQTSWFGQDSAVAYRVVWGTIDANNNLVLGTPSQRSVISNPLINLLLRDYARLLGALDDVSDNASFPSLISDGDYVDLLLLPISATATELRTNAVALAVKIDNDLLYADNVAVAPLQISTTTISTGIATINFSSGNPQDYWTSGSNIYLSGFIPTTGTLDGPQVISTVTTSSITFTTTATGPVSAPTPTINSYEFRIIPTPGIPTIPETDQQLVDIQTYLENIILKLQESPSTGSPPTISANSQTNFISILDVTKTATVVLDITIPQGITTNYFYQIYRSPQAVATGPSNINDVVPSDELQQVYEAFVTTSNISAGHVVVEDITPDAFRGANLYTNATTGEGILQSNDIPPAALDINRFKNVVFYANTRTRHKLLLNLLGVANMVTDFNNSITPKINISNGTTSNTYKFVTGLPEISQITCTSAATLNASGTASYFLINSANDITEYYVWYKIGTATDPGIAGKIGIEVEATAGDSANQIADKTASNIAIEIQDFNVALLANVVTVTNSSDGNTTDTTDGTTGFGFLTTQQGRGEDESSLQVLLSTSASPAQAVDQTARSLVRIINENPNESVYAYYLSGAEDVPGKIQLEERTLSTNPFYLVANNANTGLSFNPDLSPTTTITSISVATETVITTFAPHGMTNKDKVVIVGSDSTPSVDGLWQITYISPTSFSVPVNVTIAGTTGSIRPAAEAPVSSNEQQANRIYYSKFLQPEAVPIVNFLDVGAKDQAILRIFPLRDSLFVFKEDGIFRISGEESPFSLALFDTSVVVVAPDSVDVSNNVVYCWSTQGIVGVTESGTTIPPISRPIDNIILKLATSQYTNFPTATWGIGYESDNSYTVYTVQQTSDTLATVGYRYSTLTNSWTVFDKSCTCGVVNQTDGKQYLGAGDINFLEQERKDFARYDYADREFPVELAAGNYFGNQMLFSTLEKIEPGDVFLQNQYVTVYDFNALLQKLDTDPTLGPHNYFSTLQAFGGDNIRNDLDALITKLANDPTRLAQPGATAASVYTAFESINTVQNITNISADDPSVITCVGHGLQTGRIITIAGSNSVPTVNNTYQVTVVDADHFTIPTTVITPGTTGTFTVENNDFLDVQASFNNMIETMNLDPGISFLYQTITFATAQESIVTDNLTITNVNKKIVVNLTLDYLLGPITVFKAITSRIVYSPQTLGDALGLKHMRESTMIFENKAFTSAVMSFSTDLLPQPVDVPFLGDGNGIFGNAGFGTNMPNNNNNPNPGFGGNFFGGGSNSAPFRTYIPRDCQRCRFLICEFTHGVAREQYAIFGLSLTGEISQSTRAYR